MNDDGISLSSNPSVSMVGLGSPIRTLLENPDVTLLKYRDEIGLLPLPEDDYDHHTFLRNVRIRKSQKTEMYSQLIDELVNDSNKRARGPNQLAVFRYHWECVVCCLSQAFFMRRWLVVSLDKERYGDSGNFWIKKCGFTYRCSKDIVDYLRKSGLVSIKPGKVFKDQPSGTRMYPSGSLVEKIWAYFLYTEEEMEPPYVCINEPHGRWGEVINILANDHPDVADMILINEYLKSSHWVCKAPIRLVYKHDILHGGRLITPFQSLPDRSVRLRINTLLDGLPICEVDYNANHLRLNLAALNHQHAGDTPYEDIMDIAGLDTESPQARLIVKQYITKSMGAADEHEARGAFIKSKGANFKLFEQIKEATYKRYPKIVLFKGWGTNAQSLEGEILRKVMVEGVNLGIASLPVHDALAVNHEHADWAQEAMARVWVDVAGGVGTKLKVDYPTS